MFEELLYVLDFFSPTSSPSRILPDFPEISVQLLPQWVDIDLRKLEDGNMQKEEMGLQKNGVPEE